jgi:S-formylglutathione hydrolase FrmB
MGRSRALLGLTLGLAMTFVAGCGSTEPAAIPSDELPPRLDNGARGRTTSDPTHVPPARACRDTIESRAGSLVTRVLPDGPRREKGKLAFRSGVCVYVPPGYVDSPLRYPVVYLLHGGGQDPGDVVTGGRVQTTMDELIAADPAAAAIVVMPDGDDGQWYDGIRGKRMNETYVTGYVVPYIDEHFRTIGTRSGRAITGVSNGGYGAILFAQKHPDMFAAAGGMSSNLDWFGARGLGKPGASYYRANHPAELVDALVDTDVILDIASRCVSTDPADECAKQGLDQTFLPANRAFVAALEQVPARDAVLDYREGDGTHGWRTWVRWLRERQLPFLVQHLADPTR